MADPTTGGLGDAGLLNAGQDCTAATRIIATPRVHDAVVQALVPAALSLKLGEPLLGDDVSSAR